MAISSVTPAATSAVQQIPAKSPQQTGGCGSPPPIEPPKGGPTHTNDAVAGASGGGATGAAGGVGALNPELLTQLKGLIQKLTDLVSKLAGTSGGGPTQKPEQTTDGLPPAQQKLYTTFDRQYLVPMTSIDNPRSTTSEILADIQNLIRAREQRMVDVLNAIKSSGNDDPVALQRVHIEQDRVQNARAAMSRLLPIQSSLTPADREILVAAARSMAISGNVSQLDIAVTRILGNH